MTVETHFVQAGDGPILIGAGGGTLACACGHTLVQGYDATQFLAVGIQCARCGTLTTTAPLPASSVPPRSAIVAAPSPEPRDTAMTVPAGMSVIGQAEMVRLQALFQPANPDYVYPFSDHLLDEAAAAFAQHTGAALPAVGGGDAFTGMDQHALGWAVGHLRERIRSGSWACAESPASGAAVTLVAGFLHFLATWSPGHPLRPAMVATAAARGFSLHGLAPFAAAHCLIMMGNRVRLAPPQGYPAQIEGFDIVAGADLLGVQVAVLDRFEFPFAPAWTQAGLLAAVSETLERVQGRINLRNPGVLVLSAGNAQTGYDEALIRAVQEAIQTVGRRNRGLMAVAPVTLRLQALPDPHAIRFCYGFFPVANRHYRGEHRLAGQQDGQQDGQ